MSLTISVLALLIALGTLIHTLTTTRRNNKRLQREKKNKLLLSCIDLRVTYGVMLSNVLTKEVGDFREEVREVIIEERIQLPKLIEQIDSIQTKLKNIPYEYEVEIENIADDIDNLKASLNGLIESLKHGFERGQI